MLDIKVNNNQLNLLKYQMKDVVHFDDIYK